MKRILSMLKKSKRKRSVVIFGLAGLFLINFSINAYAQIDSDKLLADQYYQQGEFEKAVPLYEKLLKKYPDSKSVYKNYINSLFGLNDFEKAEKEIKQFVKKDPNQLIYRIDLGNVYKKQGNKSKAEQEFNKVIKELAGSNATINEVANSFALIGEYDYALKTFIEGRKALNSPFAFSYEIAELYGIKGDHEQMIQTYLDILEYAPTDQNLESIEALLQDVLKPSQHEMLKMELYKRIQKSPDNLFYPELLIWVQVQNHDFNAALTQVKALDRKMRKSGSRVLQFAELCTENHYYDVAIEACQYVIQNSMIPSIKLRAEKEILNNRKLKIENSIDYTQQDLLDLRKDYEDFIQNHQKDDLIASAMRELAVLEAFYLHNIDKSIKLLKDIELISQVGKHFKAESKLTLGDVILLSGDKWEAILLYSQVDKAFKDEVIGDMAKYKTALVSYFTGDFEWAQTQLEVLKGSTSKFISNDALRLSTFIMDNMGMDTTTRPLELFAEAELLIYQNKEDEALAKFDTINSEYAYHSLNDDILYEKSKISIENKNYENAVKFLERIINDDPLGILHDDALFDLADIYQNKYGEKEKALELYIEIINKHKDSVYIAETRKRIRELRGDKLN